MTHLKQKVVLVVQILFLLDLLAKTLILIFFLYAIHNSSVEILLSQPFLHVSGLLLFYLDIKSLFHILIEFPQILLLLKHQLFLVLVSLHLMFFNLAFQLLIML